MSHDRKPGRVHVLSNADEAPQRRRDDAPPVVIDQGQAPAGPASAAKGKGAPASAKARLLLAVLFIAGAAAGGAGVVAAGLT